MEAHIEAEPELQRVLSACYEVWKRENLPPDQRLLCYSWILPLYEDRFGKGFHPSRLAQLGTAGLLEKYVSTRNGARRYYKLSDPDRVESLLREWSPT
ncbi:MAG TPA: hypothetical protein VF873_04530 [Gemmatimonadales bacterium]